jgi:hypothetical protein
MAFEGMRHAMALPAADCAVDFLLRLRHPAGARKANGGRMRNRPDTILAAGLAAGHNAASAARLWQRRWQMTLLAGAGLTAAAVLTAGTLDTAARAARAADPDLLAVLRLMAGIKAAAAISVLWLSHWRLERPMPRLRALALIGAGMLMACGPALIWTMAGIAPGALCFYTGLAASIVLLWTDRAMVAAVLERLAARRRG